MTTTANGKEVDGDAANANDDDLIRHAENLVSSHNMYFLAADCLNTVTDKSLLQPKHHRILEFAEKARKVQKTLLAAHIPSEGWFKQSETHGHRDTLIYYKVNPGNSLVCRVETPIESSLLVPLLSVLNETQLYHKWAPGFKVPKIGLSASDKLFDSGRGHQIVDVKVDMPFPLNNRQCIQHAFAVDSIDADLAILIKIDSMDTGNHFELEIPPVEKGYRRVDYDAGFMVQSCPPDHEALMKSKHLYPPDEKMLLISLVQHIDAHVAGVPLKLINFFNRTILGRQWSTLLQVAEDVKTGKRPEHKEAIDGKPELYGWVEERIQALFHLIEEEEAKQQQNLTNGDH